MTNNEISCHHTTGPDAEYYEMLSRILESGDKEFRLAIHIDLLALAKEVDRRQRRG